MLSPNYSETLLTFLRELSISSRNRKGAAIAEMQMDAASAGAATNVNPSNRVEGDAVLLLLLVPACDTHLFALNVDLENVREPNKEPRRVQAGNDGARGPYGRPGGSGQTIDEDCRWRGDASEIRPSTTN
ncbi:hypothetical protein TcasGA2_TC008258 [Tribolium castaneum]|uniref:Uncharacterized protein n=1 Tax=Tribolium castaneum TaxID=7070 RepID=D2A0R6_TRICA|nr:hypothetical protein TcasGA2_TC008258 [Tribolium castaneum]